MTKYVEVGNKSTRSPRETMTVALEEVKKELLAYNFNLLLSNFEH